MYRKGYNRHKVRRVDMTGISQPPFPHKHLEIVTVCYSLTQHRVHAIVYSGFSKTEVNSMYHPYAEDIYAKRENRWRCNCQISRQPLKSINHKLTLVSKFMFLNRDTTSLSHVTQDLHQNLLTATMRTPGK